MRLGISHWMGILIGAISHIVSIKNGQVTSLLFKLLWITKKLLPVLFYSYCTHELGQFDWSTFKSLWYDLPTKEDFYNDRYDKNAVSDRLTKVFVCINIVFILISPLNWNVTVSEKHIPKEKFYFRYTVSKFPHKIQIHDRSRPPAEAYESIINYRDGFEFLSTFLKDVWASSTTLAQTSKHLSPFLELFDFPDLRPSFTESVSRYRVTVLYIVDLVRGRR